MWLFYKYYVKIIVCYNITHMIICLSYKILKTTKFNYYHLEIITNSKSEKEKKKKKKKSKLQ